MRPSVAKCMMLALAVSAMGLAAPKAAIWINVPFVGQERNGCGSACVAMILRYWRKGDSRDKLPTPSEIYQELYRPAVRGVLASEMERYFQEHGFRAFAFRGTWNDLEHHLSKGRPLIVCLGAGDRGAPLHYAVVAGLDVANQTILVNDPARRKLLAEDREEFERRWAAEDNWTLLAVPR